MEEEATTAAESALPAIDYTNADQVMLLVQEQGTDIGMKLAASITIFLIGRWLAHMVVNMVRKALSPSFAPPPRSEYDPMEVVGIGASLSVSS